MGDVGAVLVVVPTYDEAANIASVVGRLRAAVPAADVLVVDDDSPDGTGLIADGLSAEDHHVSVLHRPAKQGLGRAYLAGFRQGLDRGYDVLVEMDADGSHQPEELPRLLAALTRADVVLGSRWVPGGAVRNWPATRRLLSRGGTAYARLALGLPIRDATSGYRAIRAGALEQLDLDTVASQGYCFQIDLARRAVERGLRVVEVPITFVERERGASKMSGAIVREALWRVTVWGVGHRVLHRPRTGGRPVRTTSGAGALVASRR
ncbi:polyprenol monophosphomannose synthase [Geodermatophilus sp. SYSU D01062]